MCQPKKEKKFYPLNILIIKMTTIEIFNLEKKKKKRRDYAKVYKTISYR